MPMLPTGRMPTEPPAAHRTTLGPGRVYCVDPKTQEETFLGTSPGLDLTAVDFSELEQWFLAGDPERSHLVPIGLLHAPSAELSLTYPVGLDLYRAFAAREFSTVYDEVTDAQRDFIKHEVLRRIYSGPVQELADLCAPPTRAADYRALHDDPLHAATFAGYFARATLPTERKRPRLFPRTLFTHLARILRG